MAFLFVSLGFPYMVSVFLCFPDMVCVFPCAPYMVILPKHLNVKAIVLDSALLWAAIDDALSQGTLPWRHSYKTVIVSWTTYGPERDPPRRSRTVNWLVISWISKQFVAYFFEITFSLYLMLLTSSVSCVLICHGCWPIRSKSRHWPWDKCIHFINKLMNTLLLSLLTHRCYICHRCNICPGYETSV